MFKVVLYLHVKYMFKQKCMQAYIKIILTYTLYDYHISHILYYTKHSTSSEIIYAIHLIRYCNTYHTSKN